LHGSVLLQVDRPDGLFLGIVGDAQLKDALCLQKKKEHLKKKKSPKRKKPF
jgi:hypothetical protein